MKRAFLVACVTIGLTATFTHAADPGPESTSPSADKTAAVEVSEPVIPKRELKFDVSEEQYPLPLDSAHKLEQLLQQHYVARFTLVATEMPHYYKAVGKVPWTFKSSHFHSSSIKSDLPNESPLWHIHVGLNGPGYLNSGTVKSLLDNAPRERWPSEAVVSLLTTNPGPHVRARTRELVARGPNGARMGHQSLEVLAPTAEEARALVEGLLTLLDKGFFRPFQAECLRGKRTFAEDAAKYRAEANQHREEAAGYQKELDGLKEYKDINKEAVGKFTAQVRLIGADIKGVQARLVACEKILATHQGLRSPRTTQVETLKITAEIELVGLVARKAALEEIVNKGQRRNELVTKKSRPSAQLRQKEKWVADAEKGVAHYEAQRLRVVPYPVKDGKVTIRRIKWESPAKDDAAR